MNNTALQVINNAADLAALFGDASANPSATVISMWFVTLINDCGEVAAFGCANTPGNRIAIDDDTFSFNGGVGRIDTLAHEIGHSLGLPHCNDADRLEAAACGADFLMRSAGRTIPAAVGDIDPTGLKLDKLSACREGHRFTKSTGSGAFHMATHSGCCAPNSAGTEARSDPPRLRESAAGADGCNVVGSGGTLAGREEYPAQGA